MSMPTSSPSTVVDGSMEHTLINTLQLNDFQKERGTPTLVGNKYRYDLLPAHPRLRSEPHNPV